jgi:hypothetical protein
MADEVETPIAKLYRERQALLAKSERLCTALSDAEMHYWKLKPEGWPTTPVHRDPKDVANVSPAALAARRAYSMVNRPGKR